LLTLIFLSVASITIHAQEFVTNQFYTYAEVFESAPLYGKSSLQCITCDEVLLGYKIALRMVQKGKDNDTEIIFETVVKMPIPAGTWVKIGVRADAVAQ
jgi:hypothetical protein